jgi:hypothetical protein
VSADPREALRWFDGQKAAGNALADDPVMVRNMLRARARLEPAAAVARMAEMTDAAQFTELGESMAKELRNPREYETFLRACADGMADSKEQGAMAKIKEACLRGMAQKMRGWPLEDVRSLADSCLSPEERIKMAGDLNMGIAPGMFEEPVAWADWLAEVGEPTRGFSPISSFMGRWAPQDPEASVAWLRRLPEGLTKSRAVSSYAEAMAETRGSQAISLINENLTGSRHTSTLKTVRSRWRKQDPEGEAAYAREHGLPPL